MAFHITSLYASILAIAAILLSILVSVHRGKAGVALMDGGNPDLMASIRRHGNFTENVPFVILLMALAEARGMPGPWLHGIGILLCAARLIHVFGLNAHQPANPLRIAGNVGTHLCVLGTVVFLLWSLQ